MRCAKCGTDMAKETHEGIEIDRCPDCQGLFLDQGELERLLTEQLGDLVDRGDFSQTQNELPAHCQRCHQPMLPLIGLAGVRFEYCTRCKGLFFDSGELTILHHFQLEG